MSGLKMNSSREYYLLQGHPKLNLQLSFLGTIWEPWTGQQKRRRVSLSLWGLSTQHVKAGKSPGFFWGAGFLTDLSLWDLRFIQGLLVYFPSLHRSETLSLHSVPHGDIKVEAEGLQISADPVPSLVLLRPYVWDPCFPFIWETLLSFILFLCVNSVVCLKDCLLVFTFHSNI